jgi:hypothetical protein
MARKPDVIDVTPEHSEPRGTSLVGVDSDSAREALERMNQEAQLIDDRYGDGLPYDRGRVVSEARFYLTQSATAMLEAGRRLVLLKEREGHGEFRSILETELGLSKSVAHRMMQTAVRAANVPTLGHLGKVVQSKAKLFELMVLDDDSLEALGEGATVANLTLDKVERMSVRELRQALREAQSEKTANEKLLDHKNRRIDELSRRLEQSTPDDTMEQMLREVTGRYNSISGFLNGLRNDFRAILDYQAVQGGDHREVLSGIVGQIQRHVLELREEFALLDTVGDSLRPWENWVDPTPNITPAEYRRMKEEARLQEEAARAIEEGGLHPDCPAAASADDDTSPSDYSPEEVRDGVHIPPLPPRTAIGKRDDDTDPDA